jgi:membrane associated rhomboid family serine protease
MDLVALATAALAGLIAGLVAGYLWGYRGSERRR